jgi:hypothetical protein
LVNVAQFADVVEAEMWIELEVLGARSPIVQVVQLLLHVRPVGTVSVNTTDLAVPGPPLLTVTVYPTVAPADTVVASATSVIVSDGHCTVIVAPAFTVAAFDEVADA